MTIEVCDICQHGELKAGSPVFMCLHGPGVHAEAVEGSCRMTDQIRLTHRHPRHPRQVHPVRF